MLLFVPGLGRFLGRKLAGLGWDMVILGLGLGLGLNGDRTCAWTLFRTSAQFMPWTLLIAMDTWTVPWNVS